MLRWRHILDADSKGERGWRKGTDEWNSYRFMNSIRSDWLIYQSDWLILQYYWLIFEDCNMDSCPFSVVALKQW